MHLEYSCEKNKARKYNDSSEQHPCFRILYPYDDLIDQKSEDQNFYDMDISCWEKVTSLNMNGTVYPSMIFGKVMAEQKKGCIINVSSMAAYSAITRVPGYSAAKTAVALHNGLPVRWL